MYAVFAYRTNYVCGPGEHIIRSDADAIKEAGIRIIRAKFYDPHGVPGYVVKKPGLADFSQPNCCEVKKTLTLTGVIVWEVDLEGVTIGEPKRRRVGALMRLSNCGAVFDEESYVLTRPIR
jgi:hypothetical protein